MAGMNKCVGFGRSITANQKYVTKHGKLFHENCLDMFLESDKGKEWEEKFLRSQKGQEEEIDELLEEIEQYGMPDSDKIREDLESSIADDSDEEAYERFKDKLRDYESGFWEFRRQKREKEEHERELQREYDTVFRQVKSLIKNKTFYENDKNKIKDYLNSIEYQYTADNESNLQRIRSLDFKRAEEPKNGLIIAGVILIISVSFLPIGIILLIIGISKKNKAKKALSEAAEHNFGLVKSIVYAKSSEESADDSDKSAEEKISDFCKKATKWELDPDTTEQIIFLGSDKKDTNLDFDSDTDDDEIDYSESNKDKIKKAKEAFGISNSETILFGYDDTLKNSFKSGFVLTEKKLYFTDGNSFTKNTSISVTEINSITFKKKLGIAYICINDTCISITSPIGKDSEKICELLNKAVRILQKEK